MASSTSGVRRPRWRCGALARYPPSRPCLGTHASGALSPLLCPPFLRALSPALSTLFVPSPHSSHPVPSRRRPPPCALPRPSARTCSRRPSEISPFPPLSFPLSLTSDGTPPGTPPSRPMGPLPHTSWDASLSTSRASITSHGTPPSPSSSPSPSPSSSPSGKATQI